MTIPAIIHQMWYDKECPQATLQTLPKRKELYTKYSTMMKEMNPTYEYRFWNKESIDGLWHHKNLSRWRDFFFNTIEKQIERCDFSRYAILYVYGGVYLDLDMIAKKPLQDLLEGRDFGWSKEPPEHWNNNHLQPSCRKEELICNSTLFSSAGHTLWSMLMDDIVKNYRANNTVLFNTGPCRLAIFAKKNKLSEEYFVSFCKLQPITKNKIVTNSCPTNTMEKDAYVYTLWNEGTNWKENNALCKNIPVSVFIVLTVFLLLCMIRRLKTKSYVQLLPP